MSNLGEQFDPFHFTDDVSFEPNMNWGPSSADPDDLTASSHGILRAQDKRIPVEGRYYPDYEWSGEDREYYVFKALSEHTPFRDETQRMVNPPALHVQLSRTHSEPPDVRNEQVWVTRVMDNYPSPRTAYLDHIWHSSNLPDWSPSPDGGIGTLPSGTGGDRSGRAEGPMDELSQAIITQHDEYLKGYEGFLRRLYGGGSL